MENQVSRKDFLRQMFTAAGVFIGGSAILSSCGSGDESKPGAGGEAPKSMVDQPTASADCNDLSGVAPEEIKKREAVQYVKVSADPAKHCKDCQLFIQPQAGESCGGCTLFKGPVELEGSCISFAPKASA